MVDQLIVFAVFGVLAAGTATLLKANRRATARQSAGRKTERR